MYVVVTGAAGFIGRNVLLRAPRDWEIFALYRRSTDFETFLSEHGLAHVRALRCDLLDPAQVRAVADATGRRPDAVLYLAANGDPAVSAERPRWDLDSNTTALVNFLEHCPAEHVVYLSSGAVYDGLAGPVSPGMPVSPLLPYAIAKLASEHYIRFFCERRGTVSSYVNVRFFGAYGPYEPERKITSRWLRAMAAGQREFVIRGDGNNLIDFMYVDDAVDGLLTLMRARGERVTVDFASGAPVTVNEVVRAMARVLDVDVAIRHEGTVAEYIEFSSVDRTLRDRFAVMPSIGFDDGLRQLQTFLEHSRATRQVS